MGRPGDAPFFAGILNILLGLALIIQARGDGTYVTALRRFTLALVARTWVTSLVSSKRPHLPVTAIGADVTRS